MDIESVITIETDMEQAIKDMQHNLDWFRTQRNNHNLTDGVIAVRLSRMTRRVMAHCLSIQNKTAIRDD